MNRSPIPAQFIAAINEQLGSDQAAQLIESLEGTPPTSIRLNPYKSGDLALRPTDPIGWSSNGFYLEERPSFTHDSAFHSGAYYVQEASSQFINHLLESSHKSLSEATILDCCAAPGGKSTLYSSVVGCDGLVVASEINRSRASVLADNVRRWGVGNVVVACCDTSHHREFESIYDVVAVDAPCSGEGMFRKSADEGGARDEWSLEGVEQCAERQMEILQNVWPTLKSGGALIYSTCTFNRTENEMVLERFLEWCDPGEVAEYEEITLDPSWGVVRSDVGPFSCFRFMPHRSRGEGFFVAIARKSFDVSSRLRMPKSRRQPFVVASRREVAECSSWVREGDRAKMTFLKIGESIYGYYNAQMELIRRLSETLNVIYSGVEMGQVIKRSLNPEPPLALFAALNRDRIPQQLLPPEVMVEYLRKHDISAEGFSEGLNLVADEHGHAVGFAKRVGRRVNNRYPNTMRILK